MQNITSNTPNLPVVVNEDYDEYFRQVHHQYLFSEDWQKIETEFRRELQLHIVPNDLENLIRYLRQKREDCLVVFKQTGLVYSLWEKSFNSKDNRFDEVKFIQKLNVVSDGIIDANDLIAFFRYYCQSHVIEMILTKALEQQSDKYFGTFNVFINQGNVSFGGTEKNKDSEEDLTEDEPLCNIIFKEKYFDSDKRLRQLYHIIAHAINMEEYNAIFGEVNEYTINPNVQSEWYYIMKAIEEAEIVTRMSVPKFIDQMVDWYPMLFNFNSPEEMSSFKRRMQKSISHEKGLWKYGKAQEVTKLKDMYARCKSLGMDYAKVERMYKAVYKGLYLKLVELKQEIDRENFIS